MKSILTALLTLGILAGCESPPTKPAASAASAPAPDHLAGTSWRLVQIVYGDGTIRAAIDRSRYTIGFGEAGVLNVRFDCNRGRGGWKSSGPGNLEFDKDELYDEAARIVVSSGQVSISYLQRRLRVGFSRAARLVDMMEAEGLVSPGAGGKPREVLVDRGYFEEVDAQLR